MLPVSLLYTSPFVAVMCTSLIICCMTKRRGMNQGSQLPADQSHASLALLRTSQIQHEAVKMVWTQTDWQF